jgi:hypothetical protein
MSRRATSHEDIVRTQQRARQHAARASTSGRGPKPAQKSQRQRSGVHTARSGPEDKAMISKVHGLPAPIKKLILFGVLMGLAAIAMTFAMVLESLGG